MEIASKVLLFMIKYQLFVDDDQRLENNIANNLTEKNLRPYIIQALTLLKVDPKKYTNEEYAVIVLRTEAVFARYIRYILATKRDNNFVFTNMSLPEGLRLQRTEEFVQDFHLQ